MLTGAIITQGTATATYAYDDADRRTSVTLPTGAQIQYAYTSASELTTLTYRQGATTLGTLTYTYDAAGNRTKQGGTYARSNIPPALSVVSYNANNQQLTFAANTLTYDLNGNLTTVTDNLGTATYTWNARNQLTGITGTSFTASFSYDSFGRRTTKTINGFTTKYFHDGLNVVQEQNGTGGITANLLTGLGIDELLTRTDSVGARGFLTDALGTTIALVDNAGVVQTEYKYEPYGSVNRTGQASQNAFKYTGREDDATGLYYYRARYYSPRMGRFVSEDPIGFNGGSVSLYAYALNAPLTLMDPSGLSPVGWVVQLGDKCMKKVKALFSDRELRQARSQGQDILVNGTRQKAHQIEVGSNGGKPVLKHGGHQLGDDVTGKPHYQTPGTTGHTFWLGAATTLGGLLDPFDASATAGPEDDMLSPICFDNSCAGAIR